MKNVSNVLVGFVGQINKGVTVGKTYLINENLVFEDDNGRYRDARVFVWELNLEKCESILGLNNTNYTDHISEGTELKDDDREEPKFALETDGQLKASETMVGGDHYLEMGLQPLEACYLLYGYQGLKAAIYVKVVKYINRNKDNEVEQLKKARHCLDLLIEKAELEASK